MLPGGRVEGACERCLEAVHVRAAVDCLDAVDKAEEGVGEGVGAPLQRRVHLHALHLPGSFLPSGFHGRV